MARGRGNRGGERRGGKGAQRRGGRARERGEEEAQLREEIEVEMREAENIPPLEDIVEENMEESEEEAPEPQLRDPPRAQPQLEIGSVGGPQFVESSNMFRAMEVAFNRMARSSFWKCIYEKLSDEEVDSCPVCDIDLGCVPIEKLRLISVDQLCNCTFNLREHFRPDHNLQDIRAKIFPLKRKMIKSPEAVPSVSPPVKRKERSLSSLVVSAPKVSVQAGVTGKRSKFGARKNAPTRATSFAKLVKKEVVPSEDCPESSSSDETLNKDIQDRKQTSPSPKPLDHQLQKKDENNHKETQKPTVDLWKPLNFLVEAANRTKAPTLSPQNLNLVKSEPTTSALESEVNVSKFKGKEKPLEEKVQVEKNETSVMPGLVKRKRRRAKGWKNYSPQAIVDSVGAKLNRRACPIWFSLVASEDQKGEVPLARRSVCYLRILDGNLPVSFIQKYLVKKLDLTSEAEVDILCHGQPVIPTLRLRSLVDLWSQLESPKKKRRTSVGSSGEEFVMALSYSRKIIPNPVK